MLEVFYPSFIETLMLNVQKKHNWYGVTIWDAGKDRGVSNQVGRVGAELIQRCSSKAQNDAADVKETKQTPQELYYFHKAYKLSSHHYVLGSEYINQPLYVSVLLLYSMENWLFYTLLLRN